MGHDNPGETHADLNRMILDIVLRDFEPFESIVGQISAANPEVGSDQIKRHLLALLADDLMAAYLIHADPPYFTSVDVTSDTLEWYWLLITEKGKRLLQPASEPQTSVLQE
jgi:hypothetical protein